MDVPFLPLRPDAPIAGLLAATSIDAELMWRSVTELLPAFFDETLDGPKGPAVDEVAASIRPSPLGRPEKSARSVARSRQLSAKHRVS